MARLTLPRPSSCSDIVNNNKGQIVFFTSEGEKEKKKKEKKTARGLILFLRTFANVRLSLYFQFCV